MPGHDFINWYKYAFLYIKYTFPTGTDILLYLKIVVDV